MIIVIRIAGQIGVDKFKKGSLDSLKLKKKYTAILINEKDLPQLNTIKELVTYGEIDDSTLKELVTKRGKKGNKPLSDIDKILEGLKKGKRPRELGVNPNFSLHPPRGGFKKSTKVPYPQGILGKNKEINKLVKRML